MSSRIVLITGANSGIGFAIANALAVAPERYTVLLAGRSLAKVDNAISEIKQSGDLVGTLTSVQLDVTDESSIQKAASFVRDNHGKLDALINNAGIAPEGPDLSTMFQAAFTTNAIGPALVSAAFRPVLLASESPYSIYMSSITGSLNSIADPESPLHRVGAGSVAYRASKTALNMIALHEQVETKGTALKTFAMCPGYVISNLRGTSEEARSGYGRATSPEPSAQLVLSILRGERDADANKLILRDGDHAPW